jgi:6-phosphogluconolactonase
MRENMEEMITEVAHQLQVGKAEITIFSSATAMQAAAAEQFLESISATLQKQERCTVALTGGGTAHQYYQIIAQRLASDDEWRRLAWERVEFFFGDERAVPPDSPQSNYRMAAESLLSNPALVRAYVHRMRGELPPPQAAGQYEEEVREVFGAHLPGFDLLLLGMGEEGHTASLFPGSKALEVSDRWVVENWVEKLSSWRITFTLPVLNHAKKVLFVVDSEQKREAVTKIFKEHVALPAALVQPAGRLLWYLGPAAGADLL